MNQRTGLHLAIAASALLMGAFTFHTSLDNNFSPDDVLVLLHAQEAQEVSSALKPAWSLGWHRPLEQLFLWYEYQLWGLESWLYLLTNLLVHAANATLVFALFRYPTGASVGAAASLLFALGFGFYGTTVLRVAGLGELMALFFVLSAGVAAARAQLLRTAKQRSASMLIAAILFLAGLLCHENALMALVIIGGLMWPNRRSVFSVVRKLSLLVLALFLWAFFQWYQAADPGALLASPGSWIRMPWNVLQIATSMCVPLQPDMVAGDPATGLLRMAKLLDQTRPVYSLIVAGGLAWWFWRGAGAVRWLMTAWLACLLPAGLQATQAVSSPVQQTYLAAAFFCGLLAQGLRSMWLRTAGVGRLVAAALLLFGLAMGLLMIRGVEQQYDALGNTAAARAARQQLREGFQAGPRNDDETRGVSQGPAQKSVPMAMLDPVVTVRKSGS